MMKGGHFQGPVTFVQVGQETCYNVPRLEPRTVNVDITLPEPVEKCQTR